MTTSYSRTIRTMDDASLQLAISIRKPAFVGLISLLAVFGGLTLWSVLAPVASAAIAQGTIIVDGSRKTVQHQDGGVVRDIQVKEGDLVHSGQVLLLLDSTRLDNSIKTLRQQLAFKLAQKARLLAERGSASSPPPFAEQLRGVDLAAFPEIVLDQSKLQLARRASLEARVSVSLGAGEQAVEAAKGLRQQLIAQNTRLRLTEVELGTASELARSGAGTMKRVLEIRRLIADIDGDVAGLAARAIEADRKVESSRLDSHRIRTAFLEGVETEIGENDRERPEIVERLLNATEQARRLQVLAPVTGHVVNLVIHTLGAVIGPGTPLMEIVPVDSPLLVDVQVRPADIGRVKVDQSVNLKVVGVDGGLSSRLYGHVILISADRIVDRNRNLPYFGVRIKVSEDASSLLGDFQLKAGMSVHAMILQKDRTLLEYLVDPTLAFLSGAMRD